MTITHTFESPKADGADATVVQPSDWNATHTIAAGYFMPRVATVTLNNAQIIGLGAGNGITVIAAPGAGKGIAVFLAVLRIHIVGTGYTGGTSDAGVILAESGLAQVHHTSLLPTPGLGSVGDYVATLSPALTVGVFPSTWESSALSTVDSLSDYENKPVVITDANLDGAYTGGNAANTLTVTVFYAIIDV